MDLTTVLLVDDDPLVRAGLRLVLSADPAVAIVGEAGDGEQAIARVEETSPAVVLMDLQMPTMDGVRATRTIRSRPGAPAVLILSTFQLDSHVVDALEAGAAGYLLKETAPTEIARAVHLAAAGESVFSAAVTERLVRWAGDRSGGAAKGEQARTGAGRLDRP
jgi:DNA-binding NarL/FixJ family response regulator